jgi:hypothetical protein
VYFKNGIYIFISVIRIKGPGISNPEKVFYYVNLVEDASTYAITQIRIMSWHIVHQTMENGYE